MTNTIQIVKTSEDNNLWILDFKPTENELTFRTSRNLKHLQIETITIKDNMVYTDLYFFHLDYLKKFLNENNIIKNKKL